MTKQSIQAQARRNLGVANRVKGKLGKALKALAMKDLNALRAAPWGVALPLVHEYANTGKVWV